MSKGRIIPLTPTRAANIDIFCKNVNAFRHPSLISINEPKAAALEKELNEIYAKEKTGVALTLEEKHRADKIFKQLQAGEPGFYQKAVKVCVYTKELLRKQNADIAVCELGNIHFFNGEFWEKITRTQLKRALEKVATALEITQNDALCLNFSQTLIATYLHHNAYFASTDKPLSVTLNLANGTVEICQRTGAATLRKFDANDFLTYKRDFAFDPKAVCPLMDKTLNKILPDPQAQQLFWEYLGYCLIRNASNFLRLQKILLMYGTGANGKSLIQEIIAALFGYENVSNFTFGDLTAQGNSGSYHRAAIKGKLINCSSEIGKIQDMDTFKKLASGENVGIRQPAGKASDTRDLPKHIINLNLLPPAEHTDAYFRRLLLLHFAVTISESEQDPELANKIIATERPGILNKALAALKNLIKRGKFIECESAAATLHKYKKESNTIEQFLEQWQVTPGTEQVSASDTYEKYVNWLGKNGKPFTNQNFYKYLEAKGFERKRGNYNKYVVLVNKEGAHNIKNNTLIDESETVMLIGEPAPPPDSEDLPF